MGRGTHTLIGELDHISRRMSELIMQLESPVLHDIRLEWPGRAEVYPLRQRDLYVGEPLMVSSRLDALAGDLVVRGTSAGQPWRKIVALEDFLPGNGVAAHWGRLRIGELEQGRSGSARPDDMDEQVLDTALQYGLVSSRTSLVAVDRTPLRSRADALAAHNVSAGPTHGRDMQLRAMPSTDAGSFTAVVRGMVALLLVFLLVRPWPARWRRRRAVMIRIMIRMGMGLLMIVAVGSFVQAGLVQGKAWLGQHLIDRAWQQVLERGEPVEPWPGAVSHPVARLSMPRLDIDQLVLDGADTPVLAWAPGMETGPNGQHLIAAHRDTHFRFMRSNSSAEIVSAWSMPTAGSSLGSAAARHRRRPPDRDRHGRGRPAPAAGDLFSLRCRVGRRSPATGRQPVSGRFADRGRCDMTTLTIDELSRSARRRMGLSPDETHLKPAKRAASDLLMTAPGHQWDNGQSNTQFPESPPGERSTQHTDCREERRESAQAAGLYRHS
jgi:hypothetical protein